MTRKHGELSLEEYKERASGDAYDFALFLFVPGEEEERADHQVVVFGPNGHTEEGWQENESGVYGEYEVSVSSMTGDKAILSRRPLSMTDMLALASWLIQAMGKVEASHGPQG